MRTAYISCDRSPGYQLVERVPALLRYQEHIVEVTVVADGKQTTVRPGITTNGFWHHLLLLGKDVYLISFDGPLCISRNLITGVDLLLPYDYYEGYGIVTTKYI